MNASSRKGMKCCLYGVIAEGRRVFEKLKAVGSRICKNRKKKSVQMVMRFVSTYAQPRSHFGDVMLSGIVSKTCAFGELATLTTNKTEVVQNSAAWL